MTDTDALTIPPANIDLLRAIAKWQLAAEGRPPTAANVYRRVNKLRSEQIKAVVGGKAWLPLPAEQLAALAAEVERRELVVAEGEER